MLQAFTRNYEDNSTDAGHQFTFYCDICNDGYKTAFIESATYKKKNRSRLLGQGAGFVGGLLGGKISQLGSAAERGTSILSQRFEGMSPEWRKEHEQAFGRMQDEAKRHFRRCPNCNSYVCGHCHNEEEGLCTKCAPRQEVYVAKAHATAMKRNIDEAGAKATVWQGKIESKTTVCPACGKHAGSGRFCNECGASMDLKKCPKCGTANAQAVRFCGNCGNNLQQTAAEPSGKCAGCGAQNPPGTKFCSNCGSKL